MRVTQDNIKIELENENEIRTFWNIIMFALDLQAERDKNNESCMTREELKMAKTLSELTEKKY